MFAESVPIANTAAERYLIKARCIPAPATGWPGDAVRFHPSTSSLIVAATTDAGTVQAVQRVRLTSTGAKTDDGRPVKLSRGPQDGAWVRLPAEIKNDNVKLEKAPLLLAEGPETGLSAWASSGHETWIALGSMAKITPPAGRTIVVCKDDDKRFSPSEKRNRDMVAKWKKSDLAVVVATPWRIRRGDKSDLNDTIRSGGVRAVRARIDQALNPAGQATADRVPVEAAREQLRKAVKAFGDAALTWAREPSPKPSAANADQPAPTSAASDTLLDALAIFPFSAGPAPIPEPPQRADPPVHGIAVDVGVGKSVAARNYAARLLVKLRKAGSKRTVTIAVPTHVLGNEQVASFLDLPLVKKYRLAASVWRGREAVDPAADEPGTKMCQNLEAVHLAQEAAADVQTAVCARKMGKGQGAPIAVCPFFERCAYQRQRLQRPDLWFVPHEMIYGEKPTALGDLAVLIVDEACWRDGLEGIDGHHLELPLDALEKHGVIPDQAVATERLRFLRNRALPLLRGMTDGPLLRDVFTEEFSPESAGEAYALEWQRRIDPQMNPAMTMEARKEAAVTAAVNKTIKRVALFWAGLKAMLADGGPEQSGWLALGENDDGARVLRLKNRRPVREGWKAPTLILDALLNPELLRPYWPNIELTADVRVQMPHMRLRQVVDRAYSKSMLAPLDERYATPEEDRRRARNLRNVRAILFREARQHAPAPVLVVCQKAVKEALLDLGPVPANISMAHHTARQSR